MKKGMGVIWGVVMICSLFFGMSVLAEEGTEVAKEIPPAPALDGNGAGSMANPEPALVEKLQKYAAEQIDPDIFASVHIDWMGEKPVIVLSLTQPLSEEQEKEIQALAGKEKFEIRLVDYSEKELLQKQNEIDVNAFEDEGVKIWYTGINVWTNRVEVAIEPFNEQTAQLVYDKYGRDMITVVEGYQVLPVDGDLIVSHAAQDVANQHSVPESNAFQTMAADDSRELTNVGAVTPIADQTSFFQRIWQAISSWIKSLFS